MGKVIVLGSINMDIVAQVDHLPKPGETISGTTLSYFPGGKGANQAIASAQSGGDVLMVGALGTDTFATTLRDFLQSKNVDITHINYADSPSGTAIINVDGNGENSIVVIPGANATVTMKQLTPITFSDEDILVCQLEIPIETVASAFNKARQAGTQTILNPAPMQDLPNKLLENTDFLILNEIELSMISQMEINENSSTDEMFKAIQKLGTQDFNGICIVTLGKNGCLTYDFKTKDISKFDAYATTPIDTTGAGDCFVGVFGANITNTDLTTSIHRSICASSLCVEQQGAGPSMPTKDDIDKRVDSYKENYL